MSKFKVGDRVRILVPYWSNGRRSHESVNAGDMGVITVYKDCDGDFGVRVSERAFSLIGEENLELVEEKAPSVANIEVRLESAVFGLYVGDKRVGESLYEGGVSA